MGGLVVGIDGSQDAERALAWALAEARRRSTTVTAVHAWVRTWDDPASSPARGHVGEAEGTFEVKQAYAQSILDAAVERDDGPAVRATARQVHGWPAETLLAVADETDAEMVVVGRSGLGRFGRFLLGSVSSSVVQHATRPVTVVPHDTADPGAAADGVPGDAGAPRVVVGVDGSPASIVALREAAHVARLVDAVVDAVYSWQITTISPLPTAVGWVPPVDEYEEWATATLRDTVAAADLDLPAERVRQVVVHASPSRGVLATAAGAERVVVGSRGLGGFERLVLGSVSRQVLEAAPCPVTVVRAAD